MWHSRWCSNEPADQKRPGIGPSDFSVKGKIKIPIRLKQKNHKVSSQNQGKACGRECHLNRLETTHPNKKNDPTKSSAQNVYLFSCEKANWWGD